RDSLRDLLRGDPGIRAGRDPAHRLAALRGDALDDVAVGRKVVGVGDDDAAVGARVDGRPNKLVEDDGGGVTDEGLPRGGTESGGSKLVTDGERQVVPLVVPAANESTAPGLPGKRAETVSARRERASERVAIEVGDDVAFPHELRGVLGERVGGVELCRAGRGCVHWSCGAHWSFSLIWLW